ncbi:hypothetical protein CI238_05547, partial [Colletotrichum incanum]
LQGIQCKNSTHQSRHADALSSYRSRRPIIPLRHSDASHIVASPQRCRGARRQEGQAEGRKQPRKGDGWNGQLEACLRDCENQTIGNAAVRPELGVALPVCYLPGQVDWHQCCAMRKHPSYESRFSTTHKTGVGRGAHPLVYHLKRKSAPLMYYNWKGRGNGQNSKRHHTMKIPIAKLKGRARHKRSYTSVAWSKHGQTRRDASCAPEVPAGQ